MLEGWLSLKDVPAEGREFSFETNENWQEFIAEFNLKFKILIPLKLDLTVLPQKKGFWLKGVIQGKVEFACDRCLEPAIISFKEYFEFFEEKEPAEPENMGESLLRFIDSHYELNIFQLIWEQFLLSLPDKKLCQEECKGLCPKCGTNLNLASCNCEKTTGDPRLSIFRQLKLKSK
ncbi:MAG: hypothetical protein PWR24_1237 [Desulfonauticus sp.]|jgi:uncharacterized protein|nr:MAG: Uncharacterized protein XD41_0911 [Desulfonauticus sp. 38_4375]MDK2921680.1 hypothetical protein [Desulfonauticus sp.]